MKKAVWLSYDLGIKGDYQGLYAWLDDHDAVECGNSVAYIEYEIDKEENLLPKLKKDLESHIEFKPNDRLYTIRRQTDKGSVSVKGNFLFGKRKANPWAGYGFKSEDTIERG